MSTAPIRIAGTQGFYGDSPMGALAIAMAKAADVLVHDALAELTLSILQKDRMKDPALGYARDIEVHAKMLYPLCLRNGIRVVSNSGGLNPEGAARRVAEILAKQKITGVKIAYITGDDVLGRLEELHRLSGGLRHLETDQPLDLAAVKPTHANVYIGSKSIKDALDQGAQLVFAGRVADPCLTLGVVAHHFGWDVSPNTPVMDDDLNKWASAIAIGHLLECGGQASGGNSYAEWPQPYRLSDLGYPIAEVHADGTAIFSRLEGQGGIMTRNTLREQLVYEIHDPSRYITPDVTVDLSGVELETLGPNAVKLSGVKGDFGPSQLKLAMGLMEGYLSDQFFFFARPYAYDKAIKFIEAVKEIWARLPMKADRADFRILGLDGIFADAAPPVDPTVLNQLNEIGVRITLQHQDAQVGKTLLQAITCLGLNGPPGLISVPGWGNTARAQLSLWPTLIDRRLIDPKLFIIES